MDENLMEIVEVSELPPREYKSEQYGSTLYYKVKLDSGQIVEVGRKPTSAPPAPGDMYEGGEIKQPAANAPPGSVPMLRGGNYHAAGGSQGAPAASSGASGGKSGSRDDYWDRKAEREPVVEARMGRSAAQERANGWIANLPAAERKQFVGENNVPNEAYWVLVGELQQDVINAGEAAVPTSADAVPVEPDTTDFKDPGPAETPAFEDADKPSTDEDESIPF